MYQMLADKQLSAFISNAPREFIILKSGNQFYEIDERLWSHILSFSVCYAEFEMSSVIF